MICNNCNNEIKEGSKFCGKCGFQFDNSSSSVNSSSNAENSEESVSNSTNTIVIPQAVPPAPQFTPNNETINNKKSIRFSKNTMIMISSIAAAIAIVIISIAIFMNTGTMSFYTSVSNTLKSVDKSYDLYQKQLPALTHFSDISKSTYSIEGSINSGFMKVPINLDLDLSNNKMKADAKVMGYDYTLQLTNKTMILDTDLLNDIYGINFTTINEDLQANELYKNKLDSNLPDINPSNWAKIPFIIQDIITDTYSKNALDIIKSLDIEYEGKEKKYLFGQDINAKEYELTINPEKTADVLYDVYMTAVEDIITHKEISPYLEYLEEITGESIEEELKNVKQKDILADLKNSFSEPIKVYTYKNKIAQIVFEDDTDELIISFNPATEVLVDCKIEGLSNSKSVEELTLKLDGQKFEYYYEDRYSVNTFTYDASKSSGNAILELNGREYVFDIDTSTKNTLQASVEIPYSGINIDFKSIKGAKLNSWMSEKEGTDYTNFLKLDQMELMSLTFQLAKLFW